MLRLIAGLETPDSGEVAVNGIRVEKLPPHRRGVSLLPQRPVLFPQLTVRDNLKVPGSADFAPLKILMLENLMERYPHQLSGGERQRVALGVLRLQNRPVWLLDEPMTALDPVFRAQFRADLPLFARASGATMLIVTHDPTDALAFGHRIGVLADGALQQLGTPEELRDHPSHRFVAFCTGVWALLDGTGDGKGSFTAKAGDHHPIPTSWPAGPLTLGFRKDSVVGFEGVSGKRLPP